MKKLIYIVAVLFAVTSWVGCQKETSVTEDPHTSYFYSLKGDRESKLITRIYEIKENEDAECAGYFIESLDKNFDFIIEVSDGIPADILNDTNLLEMEFEIDLEFTGIAYNCKRSYKVEPGGSRGYPVEIQQATILRFTEIQ